MQVVMRQAEKMCGIVYEEEIWYGQAAEDDYELDND